MKISFIIPTYNTRVLTRQCVESLRSTTALEGHEVLIIDDGSTDGTVDGLEDLPPEFKAMRNPVNRGYAESCNRAAAAARGELLCFCNSDLVFTPGWLAPMVKAWHAQSAVGIVGNVQRRVLDRRIDHVGVGFLADGRPYHIGTGCRYLPARHVLSVPAVTAACCLVSRSLFEKFGGFDSMFLNGYEDTDLCLRLNQAGYRHYTAGRSVVWHHISASPGRKDHEAQNQRLFLERWRNYCEDLHARENTRLRQMEAGLHVPRFFHIGYYCTWGSAWQL